MSTFSASLRLAALSIGLAATAASAQTSPVGTWIDHTGRGAVEIAECGQALCGHVVWVKDGKNSSACRTQILGNVRSVGSNTWDRGWILDPDNDSRYSVELKPVGADKLRVTGYMGSKLFSETMTWKRAPDDLKRCDGKETVAANTPPAPVTPPAPAAVTRPAESTTAEPPRVAATPPATTPSAPPETDATAPSRVGSSEPQQPAASEPPQEAEQPAPRRSSGKRKTASKDCKLELPYITVTIPCDAF